MARLGVISRSRQPSWARAVETAAAMEIKKGGLRQFLLDDFHRCLEKLSQKTLWLFHSYHSARCLNLSESGEPNTTFLLLPDDERGWEVGPIRSTGEAAEQCGQPCGGGSGGKGSGQGEPDQARQTLDTEPGWFAQCAGTGRSGRATG